MKSNESLEQTVRKGLDAQADRLDATSLSRLRQARAAAVEQARAAALEQTRGTAWRQWFESSTWVLPASGLAAAIGIAIGLSVWLRSPTSGLELHALSGNEAMLVEMAEADLDMELIEEIEFYDWLMLAQAEEDSP